MPVTLGAARGFSMTDNITVKDALGTNKVMRTTDTTGSDLHVPIHRLDGLTITGPAAQSVLNTDLLGGVVNGWVDVSAWASGAIQIIAGAGITAGAIIFEQTNDSSSTTGIPLEAKELGVINANPVIAAVTIAASTRRSWAIAVTCRYIRVRISTAFSGGTVQAIAQMSSVPFALPVMNVQQATAASLAVAATSTPANATGHFLSSAASTNATSVKTSAGSIYGLQLTNLSASVAFVKLYRKSSAPVVGTDVPDFVIRIGANSHISVDCGQLGIRMTSGIAYAITGGSADTDTTAVAAGDVRVSMHYI